MQLKQVTSDSSYIDTSFAISDPFGYYGVIELRVYEANHSANDDNYIAHAFVSPDDSDYRFTEKLLPKTKYRVVLGYYPEYDESDEDEGSFKVMDTMRVWTKTVNCDFTVRSITSSGIEYALSINDDYPAYSARAVLYDESGSELSENEVDVSEAANGEVTEWFDAAVGEDVRTYRLELQIFAANSSQATVLKTITAKNPYYNSGSGSGSSGTSGGSTSGGSASGGSTSGGSTSGGSTSGGSTSGGSTSGGSTSGGTSSQDASSQNVSDGTTVNDDADRSSSESNSEIVLKSAEPLFETIPADKPLIIRTEDETKVGE